MITALAMDFAGVIVRDGLKEEVIKIDEEYGLQGRLVVSKDKCWEKFALGRIDYLTFWRNMFYECGIRLADDDIEEVHTRVLKAHIPYENIISTLKYMRQKYRTIMASNISKEFFEYFRGQIALDEIFDDYVLSYRIMARKPNDKEFYGELIKKSGVYVNEIAYGDDRFDNLNMPRRMGIHCFQLTGKNNPLRFVNEA